MNAGVEASIAEKNEAKHAQATGFAYVTPIEVFQTRQQRVATLQICTKDLHWNILKTKVKGS